MSKKGKYYAYEKYVDMASEKTQSLLDNPLDGEVSFDPAKVDNKRSLGQFEQMLNIFQNRKKQILERQNQPGIAQTRLDY